MYYCNSKLKSPYSLAETLAERVPERVSQSGVQPGRDSARHFSGSRSENTSGTFSGIPSRYDVYT